MATSTIVIAALVLACRTPFMRRVRAWQLDRAFASSGSRATSARLVDLPYARHATSRGEGARQNIELSAAATSILANDDSPHARGRAFLLVGDTDAAVAHMREAAKSDEPEALSDLGAALITQAEETDSWEPAIDAVVATRQAIARDPALAAAHFNLALALERLGLTNEAHAEFTAASRLDGDSSWAGEAMERARLIPRRAATDPWSVTEKRLNDAPDPAQRKALILEEPYLARINAEGPYLTSWASARVAGRDDEAKAFLEQARRIAFVLRDTSGERLAFDAVTAIDRAELSGNALTVAQAHLVYLQGRLARRDRDETRAVELLTTAARQLAAAGSPLQYVARYYVAGALFEQGRINDALEVLESLEAEALQSRGYRGLVAQLGWEHGICLELRGEYAEALDVFDRSQATAEALGEHDLSARFDGLAAEALDLLGQPNEAWRRRIRMLRTYAVRSQTESRIAVSLSSAAQVQMTARVWSRAEVLLDYAIPLATAAADPIVAAQALAKRSVVRDELRDPEDAARDRQEALAWARRVSGEAGERLRVEIDIAEGVALRGTSPRLAIAQFTKAIERLRERGHMAPLPRLLFERARVAEAAGDLAASDEDLRSGLEVVRQWERSVATIDQRAALSIWSEAIRRDLIAHALTRGDVASAFAYADDRYSAVDVHAGDKPLPERTLLRDAQAALAQDAAILEYATVRQSVVVFVVRSGVARAVLLPASAAQIATAADALRRATDEALPDAASALHQVLLAPIRDSLQGVTTLAIVPTPELTAVPFGALRDDARNRYLIEDVSVVTASTAKAAVASSHAIDAKGAGVIAIGSDAFDRRRHPDASPLPNAGREARTVASQWTSGRALTGTDATADHLRRELPGADVIHYAGHIVGRGADARLLLAPDRGEDNLTSRDIAALPLHARVVVLAGCRGSGVSSPQTIIGDMASGFVGAGARSVVASAMDIEDAESFRTMRRVHSFLAQGFDAAQAVRQAVLLDFAEGRRTPLSLRLIVHGGAESLLRR